MRIIAGEFRRRRIESPPETSQTRPIPDRVKEALFNLLHGNVEGAVVVDVFAGTGPIGLEAISRGAASCTFVEKDRRVAQALRRNMEALGCADRCGVIVADALGMALEHRLPETVDLLFFDPPYPLMEDERSAARVLGQFGRLIGRLSDDGFAVLRTPWPYLVRVPDSAGGAKARDREALVEADEEDVEGEPEGGPEGGPARADRRPGKLTVAGAVGPECHPYGSTALQLYMRERELGGDAAAPTVESTS